MATQVDWSAIASGEIFQSLVSALIFFEEPTARTFIQLGRDGAQDAVSADGKRIWQAKYHQAPNIGKTIRDAQAEAMKIATYRTPGHAQHEAWKHGEEWTLVTNTPMNAAAYKRWEEEVVPKFNALGLEARLWPKEKLEALLTKYPHVSEAYFTGKSRCFLSLQEALNQAESDAISATGLRVQLEERDAESARIADFLGGSKKLAPIHGPGGVGKSRFLLEEGRNALAKGLEVLWGQEATLSNTADWFAAIPERPTLLLLDEPKDARLLDIIAEQIRPAGRMRNWKVLVCARSPKDPILKAIAGMGESLRDEMVELKPLSPEGAKAVAAQLVATGPLCELDEKQKERLASELSSIGSRYPVWIVMAVRVLEKDRNLRSLPNNAHDIAKKYVDEVIDFFPTRLATQQQIQIAIRWLAIYGELNTEEATTLAFIAAQCGFSDEARLRECFTALVERRFVVRRGVGGRLYSIRPDVVREFVVREWLIQRTAAGIEPTSAATGIVRLLLQETGADSVPNVETLLRSLALLEVSARSQEDDLDLLSSIINALRDSAANGTVRDQQMVIQRLHNVAFARVADVLDVADTIRRHPKPPLVIKSLLFGEMELTHNKVTDELPWLVFETSRYAATKSERAAVLQQMIQLLRRELHTDRRRSNDGKRAGDLIRRVITTEDIYRATYWDEAFDLARDLLKKAASDGATDEDLAVIRSIVTPFLTLEREQTDFKKHSFTSRRWFVTLASVGGRRRDELRQLLRLLVETPAVASNVQKAAWDLLDEAHSSVNRIIIPDNPTEMNEFVSAVREDVLEDLVWVLAVLKKGDLRIAELKAARGLWDWHFRFEKDSVLRDLANRCEEIYQTHPLVARFHTFFNHEDYKEAEAKAAEFGDEYGQTGTEATINEFLSAAAAFAPADSDWGNIGLVADRIGKHWKSNPQIESFVRSALRSNCREQPFTFAARTLNAELRRLRDDGDDVNLKALLQAIIAIPDTANAKDELLLQLFGRPHPLIAGLLRVPDFDVLSSDLSRHLRPDIKLGLLSGVSHVNWLRFQEEAESIWSGLELHKRTEALAALINGLTFLHRFKGDYPSLQLTEPQFDWLLDLFLCLPDLEELRDHAAWELSELSNRFGKKPISWIQHAISKRLTLTSELGQGFKAIPAQNVLMQFVSTAQQSQRSPEAVEVIGQLLQFTERRDMLGYKVPEYAAMLDPSGAIVPDQVASKLQKLRDPSKEQVLEWARFAGHYPFNSEPWRKIAGEALALIEHFSPRDKASVYVVLLDQGFRSSSYGAGEMDPQYKDELDRRRRERAAEQDPKLIPFRDWHVHLAEADFERALAEFREEENE